MTWTRYARREHAPISARLLQQAQQGPYFQDATGLDACLTDHVWVNDNIYIPTAAQETLKDAVRRQLVEDWSFLDDFCRRCRGTLESLSEAASALNEMIDEDTVGAIKMWFDAYRAAMAFVPIFRTIDRVLAEHVTAEEAETFLSEGHPTVLTKESAERSDLQALVEKLRLSGDLTADSDLADELLKAHADTYAWLRTRWYLGDPFTVDDFRDRAAAMLALPRHPHSSNPGRSNGGTPRHAKAAVLAELAYLRTHRAEAVNEAIWRIRGSFSKIAAAHALTFDEFVHLYPHEVVDLVAARRVDILRARQRRISFATALLDNKFTDAAGTEEVAALTSTLNLTPRDQRPLSTSTDLVLTGVAASSGEATGPARIVNTAQDADDVRVGDILVTTMTYPSMVAAMQRAAAIITDDGGLLSHAAVTARELGKPCVIATGNATTLLRTGDIVYVSTEQATVRRLSDNSKEKP